METRIAVISIIVENRDSAPKVNDLLHQFGDSIIGRMGLPYPSRGAYIICIAIDAPTDRINALTGALGRIEGIVAKAAFSNV